MTPLQEPSVRRALIGHTGFVGSNLDDPFRFTARFNSRDIGEIEGRSFDEVVCAGVSAKKWIANKEPDADWAAIASLIRKLETVETSHFILISTIDVYPDPQAEVDEDFDPPPHPTTPMGRTDFGSSAGLRSGFRAPRSCASLPSSDRTSARSAVRPHERQYGRQDQPERVVPVVSRPPPLAGHRHRTQGPRRAREPVHRADGHAGDRRPLLPRRTDRPPSEPAPRYRLRTRYADLFGRNGPYMMGKADVLDEMGHYIASKLDRGRLRNGAEDREGVLARQPASAANQLRRPLQCCGRHAAIDRARIAAHAERDDHRARPLPPGRDRRGWPVARPYRPDDELGHHGRGRDALGVAVHADGPPWRAALRDAAGAAAPEHRSAAIPLLRRLPGARPAARAELLRPVPRTPARERTATGRGCLARICAGPCS